MATRAVSVVVERSPSGLSGWHCTVADVEAQLFGSDMRALLWVRGALMARGIEPSERIRVLNLIRDEIGRRGRRRAEVTAAVPRG